MRNYIIIGLCVFALLFGNHIYSEVTASTVSPELIKQWKIEIKQNLDKAGEKIWANVPVDVPAKCNCGGTKFIVHGDGHKTPCPCGDDCKCGGLDVPNTTKCQCGCGRENCNCGGAFGCMDNQIAVNDFYTGCKVYTGKNCGPCKLFKEDYDELNRKWPQLNWGKKNHFVFVEDNFSGDIIPRFEFWKNGKVVNVKRGYNYNYDKEARKAFKDKDGYYGEIIKILEQHPGRK